MNITVSDIDVDSLLKWSKEKEVQTKRGPRYLSKAKPTDEFWALWAARKSALQAAGVSVADERKFGGEWTVCRWRELPKEELERREESVKASWATDADIEIPAPEGCSYMPFQKAGVSILSKRPANLLADSMGLGKTVQAIGLISLLPDVHRVLVIAKAGLKLNWYRELKKWLTKPLTIGIADARCFPSTDVVIINFDVCHKFQNRLEFYWDLIVVDEAHYLKNAKARRTKAIFGYKPTRTEAAAGVKPSSGIPAKRKLLLTGTPFENRPAELYPLLRYLLGDQMMSKSAFEKRYCGAGMTGFSWQANGASNLEGLNVWLRQTCLVRRLKRDVLKELPPKTRVVVELEPDGCAEAVTNERTVCAKYEADLVKAQVEFEIIKTLDSDEEYERRRKDLNRQFYVPFNEIAKVRHETALAKVPLAAAAIADDMDEIGSGKILVFAHHTDVLTLLAREFPKCVVVTGDTVIIDGKRVEGDKLRARDAAVQRFQNDPQCGPFFGSIRATGEGLTLTAASLVGFVEEDWVPGKISQCEDRAHRIGQTDNVLVKHWVLKGTMDAKMVTTNVRKQEVLDVALDDSKAESMLEPALVPKHESLATRKELRIEAAVMTEAQITECAAAVRDFVGELEAMEGVGETDAAIAKLLAEKERLTAREAALARKVCLRYRNEFSRNLTACGGWQGGKA